MKPEDWTHIILQSGFSDWNMPKPIEVIKVDPVTVGQYTGRTATKELDQKVFEHDIIRAQVFEFSGKDGRSMELVGPVIFREGAFWMDVIEQIGWLPPLHEVLSIEVIGNIHDNPELLEADDD